MLKMTTPKRLDLDSPIVSPEAFEEKRESIGEKLGTF